MYILIVGGGKVGYHLSKVLMDEGHEVTILEKDKRRFSELSEELGDMVVWGDGCEVSTLQSVGTNRADVVVAVTGDDEDNLVICQMAKLVFMKPRTIARINDPKNEDVFNELGVDTTVSTTRVIDSLIEEKIDSDMLIPLLTLKGGNLEIIQIELSKKSKSVNKMIKDISLPSDANLIAAVRGENIIVLRGDTVLQPDDVVIALTRKESEKALRKML